MIVSVSEPLKFSVGSYRSPASALLILVIVPVNVVDALPFVAPVSPDVELKVSVPFATASVTCTTFKPASESAIETALPLPVMKTSEPSS